jgi:cytochrome c oxidase subunit 3
MPDHHDPNLAHHFDTPAQQYAAGKLGMWVFLVSEILFFSALFCAYAVYRANHPAIFFDGHLFLDSGLGAINTCVLLFSSLTMAWAVHAAQLGQQRTLVVCIGVTIVCAVVFLGIKTVEYSQKWEHGLVPGAEFTPDMHYVEEKLDHHGRAAETAEQLNDRLLNLRTFFGIYFVMTGLHAFHVIGGVGVLVWLFIRAWKGAYGASYFNPVDFVGLYWHLVDLIWIYLFPLLYLIH